MVSNSGARAVRANADPTEFVRACGFAASNRGEFDDHLLIAFVTDDGMGSDGERHVTADPSTHDRWHVRRSAND